MRIDVRVALENHEVIRQHRRTRRPVLRDRHWQLVLPDFFTTEVIRNRAEGAEVNENICAIGASGRCGGITLPCATLDLFWRDEFFPEHFAVTAIETKR